jgi:hypothetical protein
VSRRLLVVLIFNVCRRDQVSQFKLEQSDRLGGLDLATKDIVDAIVKQQNVFQAAHDTQLTLTRTLHGATTATIVDENRTTRDKIIEELKVRLHSYSSTIILSSLSGRGTMRLLRNRGSG